MQDAANQRPERNTNPSPASRSRMPQPPPLRTHSSEGSAATLYSPKSSDKPSPASLMYDIQHVSTSASESTLLPRDSAGNVHHPGVRPAGRSGLTWAANPDNGRSLATLPYDGPNAGAGARQAPQQRHGFSDNAEGIRRKKSLVRPERERLNPDYRHLNYMQHAAAYEAENTGRIGFSATGHGNHLQTLGMPFGGGQGGISAVGLAPGVDGRPDLRRGRSILAREEGMANESGLEFLRRGATLRRKKSKDPNNVPAGGMPKNKANKQGVQRVPLGPWMIYCYIVTFFLPGILLKRFGRLPLSLQTGAS